MAKKPPPVRLVHPAPAPSAADVAAMVVALHSAHAVLLTAAGYLRDVGHAPTADFVVEVAAKEAALVRKAIQAGWIDLPTLNQAIDAFSVGLDLPD